MQGEVIEREDTRNVAVDAEHGAQRRCAVPVAATELNAPLSILCDSVALGDFCSGTARSITLAGGCLPASPPSSVDVSGGVARSITAVGGCLLGFA